MVLTLVSSKFTKLDQLCTVYNIIIRHISFQIVGYD